jgi:hypothetical protein
MAACPLHPQPLAFRTTVNTPPQQKTETGSRWLLLLAAAALIALITLNFVSGSKPGQPATQSTAPETTTPTAAAKPNPLEKLQGRWLRPDGGYILDLKWISSNGRVEAAYFNPRPIFVSRAEASEKDSGMEVLVELQDEGYPGCVYTLKYQADSDLLVGTYFQAALRESFDVYFERTQ